MTNEELARQIYGGNVKYLTDLYDQIKALLYKAIIFCILIDVSRAVSNWMTS